MQDLITERTVLTFHGDEADRGPVRLVQEAPVTIFLNGQELVTLLCTGHHLGDLALGFLRSEGILDRMDQVKSLHVDDEGGLVRVDLHESATLREQLFLKRTLGAGCGRASVYFQPLDGLQIRPVTEGPRPTVAQIRERMRELNGNSPLYRASRGTHNAGLATVDAMVVSREDIGRHNAVDMIVGHALRGGVVLTDKLLLTTGRASSEIVLKAARVGIAVLVSRSAATRLGVEVAQHVGMTLAGYVRGDRMTVYTHGDRLMDGRLQVFS
jgi:FdhD protein